MSRERDTFRLSGRDWALKWPDEVDLDAIERLLALAEQQRLDGMDVMNDRVFLLSLREQFHDDVPDEVLAAMTEDDIGNLLDFVTQRDPENNGP